MNQPIRNSKESVTKDFNIKAQKIETNERSDKILINLNKCEKLFQEDKSEKFSKIYL